MLIRQRSALFLLGEASLALLLLLSMSYGRADEKKGERRDDKDAKSGAVKNSAGQVVSPTGVFNVKKAELTWLEKTSPEGNARITVEFYSKPSADTVQFEYNRQVVTLKDD